MHITVLGCSGGVGPGLRTTSLLINDDVLIDAGTGTGDLSLAQMCRITDAFITHSHLDHVCGLAFMADNRLGLIDRSLRVHAIPETLNALREHLFNWTLWPDFSRLPDEKNPLLTWHEVRAGEAIHADGYTLTAFKVLHTVPAVGYVLENRDGILAFSGDTGACDELWSALNALPRLDRLIIEVAFANEDERLAQDSRHFTPRRLGQELQHLKHRPQLYLTHHKPGCEAIIEAECRTALAGRDYRHLHRGDVLSL
ncbi:MAG: 3',5'-cyclic-nucleotide phosphodiesterase [Nevskiales bacterium]|nr:3',5'-cyclic-nucleotide phosphodiesterase [Nevskiales bacterium]